MLTPTHDTEDWQECEEIKMEDMGRDPDNGTPLKVEKLVDITDDCPNRKFPRSSIITLSYTTAVRGPIVQICYYLENVTPKFHRWEISPLSDLEQDKDLWLWSYATCCGITPAALRQLIYDKAPNSVTT